MRNEKAIRTLVSIAAMILAGGFLCPLRAFKLTVSPSLLELAVEPGGSLEGAIKVEGDADEPMRVRVSVGDLAVDPQGNLSFPEPGSSRRSLAGWLAVAPAEFTLSSGRTQYVRYRLRVPKEIAGSYWGVIFFQTVPAGSVDKGQIGVLTSARLTTVLCASTTRGGVRDGRITDTTVQVLDQGRLRFSATFENLGTLLVHLRGRYEIKEAKTGKAVARIPLEEKIVFPGAVRTLTREWQGDLAPGSYLLLAVIDYGGKNVVAGQRAFKI